MDSFNAEVMFSNSNNVYVMESQDYLRVGDLVAMSSNGTVKVAGRGDVVLGVAMRTQFPSGVLAVWDEHEL